MPLRFEKPFAALENLKAEYKDEKDRFEDYVIKSRNDIASEIRYESWDGVRKISESLSNWASKLQDIQRRIREAEKK